MKFEELGYRWSSIKKVLITTNETAIDFESELLYFKNDSVYPIFMATVANVTPLLESTRAVEHNFDWGVSAQNTSYPIMPGEMVGPLIGGKLYFSVRHSTAYLTVITKEVR